MRWALTGVRVIIGDRVLETGFAIIENGRIERVGEGSLQPEHNIAGEDIVQAHGLTLAPGFIDIHAHGGGGADCMDGTQYALETIAKTYATGGTTGFLATTMAAPRIELLAATRAAGEAAIWSSRTPRLWPGAAVLGIHLEGPFLAPSFKGAQPIEGIRGIDYDEFQELQNASQHTVKLVTVAPEIPGALEFISYLNDHNIVASMGHSAATYDQAIAAVQAGATQVTHGFNGMAGMHHREPGLIGAALSDPRILVQIIADGFHIHPAVLKIALKAKGADGAVIITDSMAATGLSDGMYKLGSQEVKVSNSKCTLADGTLAGSTLTMAKAVRFLVSNGISDELSAFKMASAIPAAILGLSASKGTVEAGKDADIILLDQDYTVMATFVGGHLVYRAPSFTMSNARSSHQYPGDDCKKDQA